MFPVSHRFILIAAFGFAVLAAPAAVAANAANAGTAAGCLTLPPGFSQPPVAATRAPASLWNGWKYGKGVSFAAAPASALTDASVQIRVSGLEPGAPVTLRASLTGLKGIHWSASATYLADAKGKVDVTKSAPRYGSYSGVHAMGLVWSMQPENVKDPRATFFIPAGERYAISLEALADGRVLAKTTLLRHYLAPGVKKIELDRDGLVGDFFLPATPGRHPAVLLLGGSEGGLHPQVEEAALLAAHGYAALGLAYFQGYGNDDPRLAKLPKMLVEIPLEDFHRAAEWLRKQPGVNPDAIAIWGWSKGAEAALESAATWPKDFQAAIAYMPSSVIWTGLSFGPGKPRSSWTLGGKPVPWVNFVADPAAFAKGGPIAFAPSYAAGLRDSAAAAAAAIPVERIGGPVLLVSAGDDQIWPSSVMARQIMQRLRSHGHPYADESLCYAAAGHVILPPYRPTNANATGFATGSILFGGEPRAYAFADADAWQKSLAFLARLSARPGP